MLLFSKKKSIFRHCTVISPILRKYSVIFFVFIFMLIFAGCSDATATQQAEKIQDQQSQPAPESAGTSQQQEQTAQDEEPQEESQAQDSAVLDIPAALSQDASGNFIADGIISDEEYSGYSDMDGFEAYWASDSNNIYFAMKAKTVGYLAIGIQPGSMMKDADMVLGFVDSISVAIYDMYSTGNFGPHPPDIELGGKDDIIDFAGSEQNGYTIIEFKRLLSTGDKYDNDILTGANKIIWAYGNSDTPDGSHTKRGYGQIEIK
ncbi:MAG: hypothetical protein JW997_02025 [Actinobacteria bacterium]|nr:hypothetical protein [Actinomycetota bacterium]